MTASAPPAVAPRGLWTVVARGSVVQTWLTTFARLVLGAVLVVGRRLVRPGGAGRGALTARWRRSRERPRRRPATGCGRSGPNRRRPRRAGGRSCGWA